MKKRGMSYLMGFIILLSGIVFFLDTQSAHALATLRLSDGSTTFDVGDGCTVGSCGYLDSNPIAGAVTYVGAVGTNWWLNISTGITKPALGSAASPQMDLTDVSMTSYAGGVLTILFSETDFSFSPSAEFITTVGTTTDYKTSFETYFNNNNSLFDTTTALVGSLGPYTATYPDQQFSGIDNGFGSTDGNYSITEKATITHTAGGQNSSFNMVVNVVPEPISSILFIAGGTLMAGRRFLRRKTG